MPYCKRILVVVGEGKERMPMLEFLFMSMQLKTAIQHLSISLNIIGYMTAIGRYLFPFFLLQIAMRYSVIFGFCCIYP